MYSGQVVTAVLLIGFILVDETPGAAGCLGWNSGEGAAWGCGGGVCSFGLLVVTMI